VRAALQRLQQEGFVGAGDPDGAERAVSLNWRGSAERDAHVVTLLGERGNW
jgi:hypothetical protein